MLGNFDTKVFTSNGWHRKLTDFDVTSIIYHLSKGTVGCCRRGFHRNGRDHTWPRTYVHHDGNKQVGKDKAIVFLSIVERE
ncbi:hypothetical protein P8452_57756 [Trifolium repens]|nr:hypothetical protein P8452_57756 [Trifolium repens]